MLPSWLMVRDIKPEEAGFRPLYDMESLKPGDKVYWNQKGKSVILAVIGQEPVHAGLKIVGSHIDAPRLDLKGNPVHEQDGLVYFRTHYYGGIKKYQWPCIPLALCGVIYTKEGRKLTVNIGMDEKDPVFYITDLLIHLAQDQMKKTLADGVTGEQLQAVIGSLSDKDEKVKDAVLKLLKDRYGIEEEDFTSAELELVPAMKSRDVGFDRSLIAAYGQDDRVCSYANLEAILHAAPGEKTQVALFTDKEEIGSYGNTGMQSSYFAKFVMKRYSGAAFGLKVVTGNHMRVVGKMYMQVTDELKESLDKNNVYDKDVIVEEDVWIGSNVTLLGGAHLGRGSNIGSGSVVRGNIPPYAIVIGNPAKVVGFSFTPEQIVEHEKQLYPEEERIPLERLEKNYQKYFLKRIKEIRDFTRI